MPPLEYAATPLLQTHRSVVLDHIIGSRNPADGPSRRPDYAENVDLPSGTLIPQSALRFLPNLLPSSAGPALGNSPILASAEASLSSSGTRRLTSNPIFPLATYAPVEKLPVMLNKVSYPHCQFPPVPGNLFPVTSSPICHHQTVVIQFLSLLIDSQRCHILPLA